MRQRGKTRNDDDDNNHDDDDDDDYEHNDDDDDDKKDDDNDDDETMKTMIRAELLVSHKPKHSRDKIFPSKNLWNRISGHKG